MANEPPLKLGDSGEWVTYLQERLSEWMVSKGNSPVEASGTYDDRTEGLVKFVQGTVGLPESGETDDATWAALLEAGGGAGGEAGGEPTEEPLDMEIVQDCAFQLHDIIVWPGNPAQRVKAWSQQLHHVLYAPDGDVIGQGDAPFPSQDIGPGEYAIVEIMELSRSPGEGYKLVLQVNPSIGGTTVEIPLNVDESRNWQKA